MKKTIATVLALTLALSAASGAAAEGAAATPKGPYEMGAAIQADDSSVAARWQEEVTEDGWVKVTQEGGATLGYSKKSGVSIIQVDGYAFKDMDRDGELDVYEDWRNDADTRARDLAAHMTGEEIIPLMTHGGWSSFGGKIETDSNDYAYIKAGGRAGTTRSAAANGNTEKAAAWTNALQALCEELSLYGIPATISVDPVTMSGTIQQTAIGATFDTELVHEIGERNAIEYRAVGITMLLGPQIDLTTIPTWKRASGTYSEDPALTRDLAAAYIDGLQSTFAEDGTDLGWGNQSVFAICKHFVGTGAAEGGRDDHSAAGKYTIYPGNNFEAHLIPFFDGAFNLPGLTKVAGGLMPNYGVNYSEDGSLGELVAGAYSEFKLNLLRDNDYDGFILTDWGITGDGRSYGVDDLTPAERFCALFMLGNDQVGGTSDLENALEGYALLIDELGEEDALNQVRESARRFFTMQVNVGLFENPYISKADAVSTVYTAEANAYGQMTQEKSVIMLKNTDNLIHQQDASAEKPTVYIPYVYQSVGSKRMGYTWTCKPSMDLELASQYFNVVTDSVGDPTGEPDKNGKPTYVADDIIRASADEIANCDMVIMSMIAPYVESTKDAETGAWLPGSIQYEQYTADSDAVIRESIGGDTIVTRIDTGDYGFVTETNKENRSYFGNTAALPKSYSDYETLKYVDSVISEDCKVIVTMRTMAPMVWSEVEPMADAILLYFNGYEGAVYDPNWFADEALLNIIVGKVEPSALLPYQQPADMADAEAQLDDVPRDMKCYVDANGNKYDFAFGLNWSGVINDERVQTYSAEPLTKVESITFHTAG